MKYLLNSAVITAPGMYEYHLLTAEKAREWYAAGGLVASTIGYEQIAEALGVILGSPVPVNRQTIAMAHGDEALVFRLVLPPGSPRIDPQDKGRLAAEVLAGHFKLGLLRRVA